MVFAEEPGGARVFRIVAHSLYLLAVLAGLVFVAGHTVSSGPYGYDEADYMYISSRGFLAHWLDSPSQSLGDFFRIGLARGIDSSQRAGLSREIRESGDVNFYRHWHGPLYLDWVKTVTARWSSNELLARRTTLVFHIATFLVIYAACLRLRGPWAAGLCAALYALSFSNIRTASSLGPHALYVFCYVSVLLAVALWLKTRIFRYWYAAVILSALAFCTLEIGVILIVTLIVSAWLERRRIMEHWTRAQWRRFMAASAGTFVGTVAVVWPAAIVKLSFVKAWAFMLYLAVYRRAAWGSDSALNSWGERLGDAPLDWILLAAGVMLAIFWIRSRGTGRILVPMFVYTGLTFIALLRVASDEPRYSSPYLAGLQLIAGFTFAEVIRLLPGRKRWVAAVTLLGLILSSGILQGRAHRVNRAGAERERALLRFLAREQIPAAGKVLVPQGDVPALHYYFPALQMEPYFDNGSLGTTLAASGRRRIYDGVLYRGPDVVALMNRFGLPAPRYLTWDGTSQTTAYFDLRP